MIEPLPTFFNAPAGLIAVPLLLLGLWLVARSWRSRARLAPPRCGRCGHPIEPRDAACCAECGTADTEFRFGRRIASVRGLGLGLLLVLLSLPFAYVADRQLAGMSIRKLWAARVVTTTPDAILWRWITDETPQSNIAGNELKARIQDRERVAPIADALLALRDWPRTPRPSLGDDASRYVGAGELLSMAVALRRSGLDDQRWESIMARLVPPPTFRIRERQRVGVRLDLRIEPSQIPYRELALWTSCRELRVDGIGEPHPSGSAALMPGSGVISSSMLERLGRHPLELDWRQAMVGVSDLSAQRVSIAVQAPRRDHLDWSRDGTWTAEVEVVPSDAALFTPVRDASRRPFEEWRDAIAALQIVDLGSFRLISLDLQPLRGGVALVGGWQLLQGGRAMDVAKQAASTAAGFLGSVQRGSGVATTWQFDPAEAMVLRFTPNPAPAQDPGIPDNEIWGEPFEITIPASEMVRDPRCVAPTWNWTRK